MSKSTQGKPDSVVSNEKPRQVNGTVIKFRRAIKKSNV